MLDSEVDYWYFFLFSATECLYLNPYSEVVSLLDITNQTVTLELQPMSWPPSCSSISHPNTKYTVYYKAGTKLCEQNCLSEVCI